MTYDAGHLYVAFRCLDVEPLTAQLTQRDADLFADDSVAVLLDTYNDRQTAYYFITNPLGTQSDGRISDDGRQADAAWDAPWTSAAHRGAEGWSAEFAIPLTSLKFASGQDVTWGVNFARTRRRTLEFEHVVVSAGRDHPRVAGRPVGRTRRRTAGEAVSGHSLRPDSRAGRHVRRLRGGRRRALRPHVADRRLRDGEPGLRHGGGRRRAGQPHAVRGRPAREAPVLPRGQRALQPAHSHVLLAAHRGHPRGRQVVGQAGPVGDVRHQHGRRTDRGPGPGQRAGGAPAARRLRPLDGGGDGGQPDVWTGGTRGRCRWTPTSSSRGPGA